MSSDIGKDCDIVDRLRFIMVIHCQVFPIDVEAIYIYIIYICKEVWLHDADFDRSSLNSQNG